VQKGVRERVEESGGECVSGRGTGARVNSLRMSIRAPCEWVAGFVNVY
jgi:hypothetical protein